MKIIAPNILKNKSRCQVICTCVIVSITVFSVSVASIYYTTLAIVIEVPFYDPLTELRLAIVQGESPDKIISILEGSSEISADTLSSEGLYLFQIALYRSRVDVAEKLLAKYGVDYLSQKEIKILDRYMIREFGYSILTDFLEP